MEENKGAYGDGSSLSNNRCNEDKVAKDIMVVCLMRPQLFGTVLTTKEKLKKSEKVALPT
jgi:hypothetical protein